MANKVRGPYTTIAEIKRANKALGHNFFERSTMRFFDSKIVTTSPVNGRYFITSEQFHGSAGYTAPRAYTVRRANDDGSVDTVGPFNEYPTISDALVVAYELDPS